jgi:hypothetical protein
MCMMHLRIYVKVFPDRPSRCAWVNTVVVGEATIPRHPAGHMNLPVPLSFSVYAAVVYCSLFHVETRTVRYLLAMR